MNLNHFFKITTKTILAYGVFLFSFWLGLVWYYSGSGMDIMENFLDSRKNAVIGETSIKIQIADSEKEREIGLSETIFLDNNSGMLFVFEKSGNYGIWMKDMKYSIDIIWIDSSMSVVYIEEDVSPDTYPKIFGENVRSMYILEVPSGFVNKEGIKKGDILTMF